SLTSTTSCCGVSENVTGSMVAALVMPLLSVNSAASVCVCGTTASHMSAPVRPFSPANTSASSSSSNAVLPDDSAAANTYALPSTASSRNGLTVVPYTWVSATTCAIDAVCV